MIATTTKPAGAEGPSPEARIAEIFAAFERKGETGTETPRLCRFDLEGEGGGTFYVEVRPDGVSQAVEPEGEPDVTVALSVEDFLRIADGTFDGELAVRSERIELGGNRAVATALVGILNHGDALGIVRSRR